MEAYLNNNFNILLEENCSINSFNARFLLYEEGFIHIIIKGFGDANDLKKVLQSYTIVTTKANSILNQYFEIVDISEASDTSKEGRIKLTDFFSTEHEKSQAIILVNLSPAYKTIFRSGISFIKNKKTIITIKDSFNEAFDFGNNLLTKEKTLHLHNELQDNDIPLGYQINNFDLLWKVKKETRQICNRQYQFIRNKEWFYSSPNKKFEATFEVAENNVFVITLKGILTKKDIQNVFNLKYRLLDLLGLKNKRIYNIVDINDVSSYKSGIKKKLFQYFTQFSELNDTYFFVSRGKIAKFFLSFLNRKRYFMWYFRNNFEEAFHQAIILKTYYKTINLSKSISSISKEEQEIIINQQHLLISNIKHQLDNDIDEITKMLSQLSWDKYNRPPVAPESDSKKLNDIFELISLIYNDQLKQSQTIVEKNNLITELKQELHNISTEKEALTSTLLYSKEKYKEIFNNILDVYFEIDISGTILEISKSVLDILKHKRENVIGKNIKDFVYNQEDNMPVIAKILKEDQIRNLVIPLLSKDKSIIKCSINANLIVNKSNKMRNKIVGIIRNVTEEENADLNFFDQDKPMFFN